MIDTILADDEPHALNSLKLLIPWEHFSMNLVGTATDGRELLGLIREKQPQIVITDIVMPEMTGLEVAQMVRARHENVRFVLMSAYADFEYARSALKLGLDDLLPKPIIRSELIETLGKICRELSKTADPAETDERKMIRKVKEYVQYHYAEKLSLATVASQVYLSSAYLSRLFKQETQQNFSDYLTEVRIEAAKKYLQESAFNVNEIAQMTGFGNVQYFSRNFRKIVGMTPTEYRNQH